MVLCDVFEVPTDASSLVDGYEQGTLVAIGIQTVYAGGVQMKLVSVGFVMMLIGCSSQPSAVPVVDGEPSEVRAVVPAAGGDLSEVQSRVRNALARLDVEPDNLHYDFTPAVYELAIIGEPAIEPTFPYLLSESGTTRLHAETAIDGAIMTMHGFVYGRGWTSDEAEAICRRHHITLWNTKAMGGIEVYEAPLEARRAYIERVKRWLASRRS